MTDFKRELKNTQIFWVGKKCLFFILTKISLTKIIGELERS